MAKTKTNTPKTPELSENAKIALAILKENPKGLTIADIKKLGLENANSSHLMALIKRGLVVASDTEIEVQTVVKRKVKLYQVVSETTDKE